MPKLDKLIQRRFQELIQKAESIKETYYMRKSEQARLWDPYQRVNAALFVEWATGVLALLERIFKEDSVYYQNFRQHYNKSSSKSSDFENCLGVFRAAKEDYDGGYLFNVITLAKADTMIDLLAEAEILKNANQVDFSCIAAGIALELAVKEICKRENHLIGKFNAMNETLWKKGIYNQAKWEQLKSWYTRRNDPAHGKLGQSTHKDADDMIKGIRRFIANHL